MKRKWPRAAMSGSRAITSLRCSGGPCGDVEVSVEQVSRHKAMLRCSKCGKERTFKLPGGVIDRIGFARMEDAVARLHEGDA